MRPLLLKYNGDTEAKYEEEQTLLCTAAYFNNIKIAKLLIKYNADIEKGRKTNKSLFTLLHTMIAKL